MKVRSIFLLLMCAATLPGGLSACGKGDNGATTEMPSAGTSMQTTAGVPAQVTAGTAGQTAAGTAGQMPGMETAGGPSDPNLPPPCDGSLPVMKIYDTELGADLDPDWSCYQSPSMPVPSEARSVTFHVDTVPPVRMDVLPTAWFEGVRIDFFFGPSTLGTPAVSRTLDGTGYSVVFDIPAGTTMVSAHLHAVNRVPPTPSSPELREYGFPIPAADKPIEGSVLTNDMVGLAVRLALDNADPPDPTKAMIMTYARDCRGRDVSGARFELIDGETNTPVPQGGGPGLPRGAYFHFALPDPKCTFTDNAQAVWLMTGAPVNVTGDQKVHSYRLRFSGRMQASDVEPVVLSEQEVELFANTTSMVRLYRETPQ